MNTIIQAIQQIAKMVDLGKLKVDDINLEKFESLLYTNKMPDPDFLIRTGGEFRVSNFLLWQIAYSEIYVTDTYWPAFREKELLEAILEFQSRERRYGKLAK